MPRKPKRRFVLEWVRRFPEGIRLHFGKKGQK
jgi:hypothetical protein